MVKKLTKGGTYRIPAGDIQRAYLDILYLNAKHKTTSCNPFLKKAFKALQQDSGHFDMHEVDFKDLVYQPIIKDYMTTEKFKGLIIQILKEICKFDQAKINELDAQGRFDFLRHHHSSHLNVYRNDFWVTHLAGSAFGTNISVANCIKLCDLLKGLSSMTLIYDEIPLKKYFTKCLKSGKRFIFMNLILYWLNMPKNDKKYYDTLNEKTELVKFAKEQLKEGIIMTKPSLKELEEQIIELKAKKPVQTEESIIAGHANCLIYDNVTKRLERFEPNGAHTNMHHLLIPSHVSEQNLDKEIVHLFFETTKLLKGDITYLKPIDYCPPIGPQRLPSKHLLPKDPRGFCHWWTIYYIDMRLSNPDIDIKKLQPKIIKTMEKDMATSLKVDNVFEIYGFQNLDFNEFIRSYAIFLHIVEEFFHKVLEENYIDVYGILMNAIMDYVVQQVL